MDRKTAAGGIGFLIFLYWFLTTVHCQFSILHSPLSKVSPVRRGLTFLLVQKSKQKTRQGAMRQIGIQTALTGEPLGFLSTHFPLDPLGMRGNAALGCVYHCAGPLWRCFSTVVIFRRNTRPCGATLFCERGLGLVLSLPSFAKEGAVRRRRVFFFMR